MSQVNRVEFVRENFSNASAYSYSYVIKWLKTQEERIIEEYSIEAEVENQLFMLVNEVMSNIRFPMMDKGQLATLLLFPLVMKYKDFFMEKMRIGVAFHAGNYVLTCNVFPITLSNLVVIV